MKHTFFSHLKIDLKKKKDETNIAVVDEVFAHDHYSFPFPFIHTGGLQSKGSQRVGYD